MTAKQMASWGDFAAQEPEMAATGRQLLYQRGDGEGFLSTLSGNGLPRTHPINVGVVGDWLLAFIQAYFAKARDLATDGRYALHAHQDEASPHEFLVRGRAHVIDDAGLRREIAHDWFFRVKEAYPLYELLINHVVLGERIPGRWPPHYRSWRNNTTG
jgi:Pyridoxamine 5'-phosphate oxidase